MRWRRGWSSLSEGAQKEELTTRGGAEGRAHYTGWSRGRSSLSRVEQLSTKERPQVVEQRKLRQCSE